MRAPSKPMNRTACGWWDLFEPALAPPSCLTSPPLRGSYPVFDLPQLPELLRKHVIDEVIFAISKDDLERLGESFLACEVEGVKTRVLLTFFPHVISKVYLERLGEKPLLTFATTPENEYLLLLKRALDFVLAVTLLVLLSPSDGPAGLAHPADLAGSGLLPADALRAGRQKVHPL